MKKEQITNLKNKYIYLRNYLLEYKKYLEAEELNKQQEKHQDNTYVKKLTLTKKFYGRNLNVVLILNFLSFLIFK